MSVVLPEATKALFDAPEFATMATIEPDGRPQLSVVWIARDGDDLLMSTIEGRRKYRNMVADPRATVLVYPKDDPGRYVEVRGTVTITREGGRELIDQLSAKYEATERFTGDDGTDRVRVVVRIAADRVVIRD
jgi:PPOX class probable F420-dependent enzyme